MKACARLGVVTLVSLLIVACGDGSPIDTPAQAVAVIDGPEQLMLNCSMEATAEFDALGSSGPINGFSWEDSVGSPRGPGETWAHATL